jgi:anionic cell wall polymer biosynthesis LytR-Cps2A-Psr (LCP) family protein
MGFVRFRHSDSDLVRVQRQQALLAALKAKLRQPQTLAKLPQLLDLLDAHLDSDLTTDQKLALAGFVHDTPREQIAMQTLPSRPAGASVVTDWAQATPVIQKMFGVTPTEQAVADDAGGRRRRRHRHTARLAELP